LTLYLDKNISLKIYLEFHLQLNFNPLPYREIEPHPYREIELDLDLKLNYPREQELLPTRFDA
jgi:hypothetical protein